VTTEHEIDVVVPTFNGRELLGRCLPTLLAQSVPVRIVVVDDGSTDGTDEYLREETAVESVRLSGNSGFAAAVNRGIAAGQAPYVVLLNNDVECDSEFVERIVGPLRDSASVGMVAGLLLRPGRAVIDSYGLELDRTLSAFARFARERYAAEALHERHLLGPSGGAAAYRREALDQVGGLDEGLFAYMEDVDLALRLRAAGWTSAGAPGAIGVHLGSATFGVRSRWQIEVGGRSRAYMIRKYRVLNRGLRVALWTVAVETAVAATECVIGRDVAAVRGRLEGWRAAHGTRMELPRDAVNPELGFVEALRRRRAVLASGNGSTGD
jgi:N-acetylglucosaminyl-diphospho-decaprenol L-rhamnosyltransferase